MDINDLLVAESGRISEDIYDKTLHTTLWNDLVEKGEWPDEMGEQISVLTYERSLPATDPTWATVTFNDGTGSNCVPTAQQIEFAQTLRNYNLQQTALESPPICVNDLRFTFKRKKQLENCYSVLSQNTGWLWEHRHRDEYVRLSEHKVIVAPNFPEGSTSFPTTEPVGRLTGDVLNRFYLRLVRDGAHRDGGGVDMQDGRPQFVAIMSSETDKAIVRDDYEIREDFRNTARAPENLQALGINREYQGFYHAIDDFPPRWNFTGGAWVEVPAYTTAAATKGTKRISNPAYETAEYEDTIIFLPSVFRSLVPRPITAPGGQTEFDPQKYMGDWGWRNIKDRVENPDGTWGYFRGIFSSGSEPVFPEFGYVLRHKRANIQNTFVDADGNPVA